MRSNRDELIDAIENNFPINPFPLLDFALFPFSNEKGKKKVIQFLQSITPAKSKESLIRVAILFGESDFLSKLPELSLHADIIFLADINPDIHKHTRHLLNCLLSAENPKEFDELYCKNNPIENKRTAASGAINGKMDGLMRCLHNRKLTLGEYHFLQTQERFEKCREAAKKLGFINGDLNLMDVEQCYKLACLLKSKSAIISVCNLTNIHQYDEHRYIGISVPTLLHESPNCIVMHSNNFNHSNNPKKGMLSTVSIGLKEYYKNDASIFFPKKSADSNVRIAIKRNLDNNPYECEEDSYELNKSIKMPDPDKMITNKSRNIYKHYAASTIQFWYRRTRDENRALNEIKQKNGSLDGSFLAKGICKRRNI